MGNIRRNYALARHFVESSSTTEVLFLTGSRWFHLLPAHPAIEFVKLPELQRTERGAYRSRSPGVQWEGLIRVRREIVRGAARGFRPDLFLVDKTPRGIGDELVPTLQELRPTHAHVVLVLRDVLDEPEWTQTNWRKTGQYDALEEYYDDTWVFGDPDVYATTTIYGFDQRGFESTYCGYITQRKSDDPTNDEETASDGARFGDRGEVLEAASSYQPRRHGPPIIVTVGGGEDGRELLELSAEALEAMSETERPPVEVVLGPYLPARDRAELCARYERLGNVRCVDFVTDLPHRIARSAGVIAMGGYNTVCEILTSDTPALVVPRTQPSREQVIRASRMASLGFFQTAIPDLRQPRRVLARIGDFLRAPIPRALQRPRMDGLETASLLAQAVG